VNLARDETHLGQVLDDEPLALVIGNYVGLVIVSRCRHSDSL
jgi:hypothetical protein